MDNKLPTTTNQLYLSALKNYCFTEFRDINLILRENIKSKEDFDIAYKKIYGGGITTEAMYNNFIITIERLDKMFATLKSKDRFITYRRFSSGKIPHLEIESSFIDNGFVSTSLEKESLAKVIHSDILSYDSIAKIIVPQNTPCVYIGEQFGRKEQELLLNRNLKYKLIDINDNVYTFEII